MSRARGGNALACCEGVGVTSHEIDFRALVESKLKSGGEWDRKLVDWGTNFVRYQDGTIEIHTLVSVDRTMSIILNDAYWEVLCICEVNRVLGVSGLAAMMTVWLLARDRDDTSRITDYKPSK